MEKINDGGPAFPLPLGNENIDPSVAGMSLRDYFAAKSMDGFNKKMVDYGWSDEILEAHAKQAYRIADAMLKAREVKS